MEPNENEQLTNPPAEISAIEIEESLAKIHRAANWFFWIAALSLLNSILNISSDSNTAFLAGLGISQIIDGVVIAMYGKYHFMATILNLIVTGGFVLIGWQARKVSKPAFITGIVLYCLDAVLFLVFSDWLGLGFHIFVLFLVIKGFMEIKNYNALQQ